MDNLEITPQDYELIEQAKAVIARYYRPDHHHVGAALHTASGTIITAVHVEANLGRVTVCAEAMAIGKAISEGERSFDVIDAVRRHDTDPNLFYLVSPCGMCRELINDYMPDGYVLCVEEGELKKVAAAALLPGKYTRDARVIA
jgi:cytidine deaminase